ncbi:MAG: hypothetical protein M3381_01340 [Actinomycetota bacterium]|nr:hypothetical protein [Actinomycetota bacterium]
MSSEPVEVTGPVSVGAQLPEIGQAHGRAAAQSMWSLSDDEVASRVAAAMSIRAQADAPLVARGEADMIGCCAQLDPVLLGVLGRRLSELVDPEGTQERDEADAVDREAKSTAARTATLSAFSDKPGGSCGLFWTPRAM